MNYYVGLYVIPGYTGESGHGKHAAVTQNAKFQNLIQKFVYGTLSSQRIEKDTTARATV